MTFRCCCSFRCYRALPVSKISPSTASPTATWSAPSTTAPLSPRLRPPSTSRTLEVCDLNSVEVRWSPLPPLGGLSIHRIVWIYKILRIQYSISYAKTTEFRIRMLKWRSNSNYMENLECTCENSGQHRASVQILDSVWIFVPRRKVRNSVHLCQKVMIDFYVKFCAYMQKLGS